MYNNNCIPISKWCLFSPTELLAWLTRQKSFQASGFTFVICGPLNMHNSFSPAGPVRKFLLSLWTFYCGTRGKFFKSKTSVELFFVYNGVIINLFCSPKCPSMSFTTSPLQGWPMGRNLFADFTLQYHECPLEKRLHG